LVRGADLARRHRRLQGLKNLTDIYLAAGENEFTKIGFREWIRAARWTSCSPTSARPAALPSAARSRRSREAWHTPIIPARVGLGHRAGASLQWLATLPPARAGAQADRADAGYDQSAHPFRQDLIFGAITMQGGVVRIPDGPGLGVEIDRRVPSATRAPDR
jgi:D-galactarolactone cycloisomerase